MVEIFETAINTKGAAVVRDNQGVRHWPENQVPGLNGWRGGSPPGFTDADVISWTPSTFGGRAL